MYTHRRHTVINVAYPRSWEIYVLGFMLAIMLFPLTVPAGEPGVEFKSASAVNCYDFAEVTLTVTGERAANPFTDAVVEGTFAPKGGKPLAVEGFCDSADGSVFRIRFMPSKEGPHEYKITYRQGSFKKQFEGTFESIPAQSKGVLRVDPEYRWNFQWDGTKERFFWNGTTAYWLAGWDDETIAEIINRLDRLKVTRIRAALNGRVKDGRAWCENVEPSQKFSFCLNPWVAANPASVEQPGFDVKRFNVDYWQKFERLLRCARSKDVIISTIFYVDGSRPGVDPFGKAGMGSDDEQRYYRYAVARLGAFRNVMWDVANEYRLFRDDAWAEKMGSLIKKWDPYQHLTSTHGHGDFRFRTSEWADFAMYQSWDEYGGYEFMLKNRQEQAKTGRIIPQINEEYGYEDHYPTGWGESRVAPARSAENRSRLAWEIYLAGGHQTTGERAGEVGGWINGKGDDSMTMLERYGYIYDFFTFIPFWTLGPDTNLVTDVQPLPPSRNGTAPKSKPGKVMAARNEAGDLAVIYIQNGGVVTLKSELLRDGLRPLWFNPRDGGFMNARAIKPKVYRTPGTNDWVLLFRTPCNCTFREFDDEFEK